jgi:hypothetical protein
MRCFGFTISALISPAKIAGQCSFAKPALLKTTTKTV